MTANSLAAISLSLWPYMTWREYTQDYPDLPGVMLPALFKSRGYRTGFVHNGHLEYTNQRAFLSNRGFDVLWDFDDIGQGTAPTSSWGGEDYLTVDGLFRFIDQEPQKPFYLLAWTSATHHPYEPGPRLELEDFFAGREEPFDAWNLNRYLNLVKEADRQLGRLFDGLRERGLDQDTLVVVTGDHGEAFGEPHPTWGHGSRLYDESVKVPFVVWSPRLVTAGRRVKTVGSHVDVSPTIADLVGLPSGRVLARQEPVRPHPLAPRLLLRRPRRLPPGRARGRAQVHLQRHHRHRPALRSRHRSHRAAEPGRAVSRRVPAPAPAGGGLARIRATRPRGHEGRPRASRALAAPRAHGREASPPHPDTIPGGVPMPKPPPDVNPEILQGDLSPELLEAYLASPELAVDTETMGLVTLRDRLCVVQMCDRKGRASLVQITRATLDPRRPPAERAPAPEASLRGRAGDEGVPLRPLRRGRPQALAGHRGEAALLHAHGEQAHPHLHRPARAQGQPAAVPRRGDGQDHAPLRLVGPGAVAPTRCATPSPTSPCSCSSRTIWRR